MKKTFLIAAIVTLFSVSATYAQDSASAGNGHGKMGNRREALYNDLNLTQDQKDKLKALDADGFKQMKAVHEDNSLSEDQKKDKMKEIRMAQKEARDKILTKEQSEKLDAKMKEMRGRRGGNSGS
ncbi:hypothetical protein A8C56_21960 [Niabella ginsenosidivorans]|uniref:Uncharacterized protein n=1 Tax=Niabella ginsenosidivorans TaxID=1176587 RepID=A0A1A9I997_9BACT|nr:hypothetical protein [Niabella ginsenosidivorans]ANH83290.1 hypothetical protein A8C56_21960 [Niabella ginsenosidivorans]